MDLGTAEISEEYIALPALRSPPSPPKSSRKATPESCSTPSFSAIVIEVGGIGRKDLGMPSAKCLPECDSNFALVMQHSLEKASGSDSSAPPAMPIHVYNDCTSYRQRPLSPCLSDPLITTYPPKLTPASTPSPTTTHESTTSTRKHVHHELPVLDTPAHPKQSP